MSYKDQDVTCLREYTESDVQLFIALHSDMIKKQNSMCHSLTKGYLDEAVCQMNKVTFFRCTSE